MRYERFALVAMATAVVDQVSKLWVLRTIPALGKVPIIPGLLSLRRVRNHGFAYDLWASLVPPWRGILLVLVPAAVLGVLIVAMWRRRAKLERLAPAVSLVAGGAIGNLIDRIRHDAVLDFIQWGSPPFPAFNVADVAIVAGILWFVLEAGVKARPVVSPLTGA